MATYALRLRRGGPWDWARDMRQQVEFEDHARLMDELVDEGFILLGGPLQGDREVLMIVEAASEDEIRDRLSPDPWIRSGMLTAASVEHWTVLLDGIRPAR